MKERHEIRSEAEFLANFFYSEARRILEEHGEFVVGISSDSEKDGKSKIYYYLRSHLTDVKKIADNFEHLMRYDHIKFGSIGYFVESQKKMDSLCGTLYEKTEIL